ncbi:sulfotransferase family protein [Croceicoccus mobilis]|uniref:Sulfotransferase n=1 Tax=Croceicoccus mobilis TaxID=1703339 RepID=A0A916ZAT2_9SPHN|nr:sulfotransferase [Croceicoccus mobilis]GGD84735.1 putative sulfotransferase [Croceicoccus mobilis]
MPNAAAKAQGRQSQWAPPPRPEWVERLNRLTGALDLGGLVPLAPEEMIATAMANTGLADFGSDDWREPYQALIHSLNNEANLNTTGRMLARADILRLLEGRLRVEKAYRDHPEIEDEIIDRPVFIVGQGRTGTSILQKLLGLDPENRTLMTWEAMFPAGEDSIAARIAKADAHFALWCGVAPQLERIHDWGGDEPIETILAESMSFQCPAWLNLIGLTPGYNTIITDDHRRRSLAYAKRVMKLSQWQRPGGRWVVKSPDASAYLPLVVEVFDGVRLIWPHRDPIRAMSSAVNMIGNFIWARSDVLPPSGVFDFMTDPQSSAARLSKPIAEIEGGIVPRGQLANIRYDELMSDPLGALESTYAQIGISLGDEGRKAIHDHFAQNPQSQRKPHRYDVGDRERIARERPFFAEYQDYFSVPSEL